MKTKEEVTLITMRRVALEEAQQCIATYVEFMTRHGAPADRLMRAFKINREALMQTLEVEDGYPSGFHNMRVYIGMDLSTKDSSSPMRLFLVPVVGEQDDSPGKDYIPYGHITPDVEGFYVYDFNTPCPTTCDISSPMMVNV